MTPGRVPDEPGRSSAPAPPSAPTIDPPRAWELIEEGRYRPRRIRGSFPGRELG